MPRTVYYHGLAAIAERLAVTPNVVRNLQRDFAFPIYRQSLQANGGSRGWQWVTSEQLILQWEWQRVRLDRAYTLLAQAYGLEGQRANPYGRQNYLAVMKRYRSLLTQQTTQETGN